MNESEKKRYAKQLLEILKKDSPKAVSKKTLMQKLGIDPEDSDRFYQIRDYLIDQGFVCKVKGPGELSKLVSQSANGEDNNDFKIPYGKEKQLYDPLVKTLREEWAPKHLGSSYYLVLKTADMGRKDTGGQWSRPDITIVTKKTWGYLKHSQMEVTTFEVKPTGYLDNITGVYEAASHAMFAHYSYLMLQYEKRPEIHKVEPISKLCKRFGIGLILFSDPKDYSTFIIEQTPDKKAPNYDEIESFLTILHNTSVKPEIEKIKDW